MSFRKFFASSPSLISSCKNLRASFSFPLKTSLNNDIILLLSASPSICLTSGSSTCLPSLIDWEINALSNNEIESLTEPSDVLAINLIASSDILPFSLSAIIFRCPHS